MGNCEKMQSFLKKNGFIVNGCRKYDSENDQKTTYKLEMFIHTRMNSSILIDLFNVFDIKGVEKFYFYMNFGKYDSKFYNKKELILILDFIKDFM